MEISTEFPAFVRCMGFKISQSGVQIACLQRQKQVAAIARCFVDKQVWTYTTFAKVFIFWFYRVFSVSHVIFGELLRKRLF